MKKTCGFIVVLAMLLALCMTAAYAAGPSATYTQTGSDKVSITIDPYDSSKEYEYKLNNAEGWTAVGAATFEVSGIPADPSSVVHVREKDSTEITDVTVTRPAAPTGPFAVTPCATEASTDGAITGIDSSMEYRKVGATVWTAGTDPATDPVTGLGTGTYYVRTAGSASSLASACASVKVDVEDKYDIWVKGVEITENKSSDDTIGYSYDAEHGILTLTGTIESNSAAETHSSATVYAGENASLTEIVFNGAVITNTYATEYTVPVALTKNDRCYAVWIAPKSSNALTLSGTSLTATAVPGNDCDVSQAILITGVSKVTIGNMTIGASASSADESAVALQVIGDLENNGVITATANTGTANPFGVYVAGALNNKNTITATTDSGTSNSNSSISLFASSIANTGTITATAKGGTDTAYSEAVLALGEVNNSGTINATAEGSKLAVAVEARSSTLNNSNAITAITRNCDSATQSIGIYAADLNNTGNISATAGTANETCAVVTDNKITNSYLGIITALSDAATGGDSVAIEATTVENNSANSSKSLIGQAGNAAGGNSTGISASKLDVIRGIVYAANGIGMSNKDYAIDADVVIEKDAVELEALGTTGAIKGSVTYKEFVPKIMAGDTKTGASEVTVYDDDVYKEHYVDITKSTKTVKSITLTPASGITLDVLTKSTDKFTVAVEMTDGSEYVGEVDLEIDDSTIADFGTSEYPNVAIVAKGAGTAYLTASAGDKSVTAPITVTDEKKATSINVNPVSKGIKVGDTFTITAALTPSDGKGTISWSIKSGSDYITITPSADKKSCTVKGTKVGTAEVLAHIDGLTSDSSYAKCYVNVSKTGEDYKMTPSYGAWYYDKPNASTNDYVVTLNTTNTVSKVKVNGAEVLFVPTKNEAKGYQTIAIPYTSMSKVSHGYSRPIEIIFADGSSVSGRVAVISVKDAPPTGDTSLIPFAVSAAVSAAGACGITLKLRKKKR